MTTLTHRNIRFVPVAHRKVTFAEQVRHAALEFRPDAIALELPASLLDPILRGIARLPKISAVCWREPDAPRDLYYLPIDPCDALIEALRIAFADNIPAHAIDADLLNLTESYRQIPDDLIIDKAGFEPYVERVAPILRAQRRDSEQSPSAIREAIMARRLDALAEKHTRVLCILGLAHYLPVRRRLEHRDFSLPEGAESQIIHERPGAFLAHVHRCSLVEVLGEIPYVTHLYNETREEQELTGESGFDKLGALQRILQQAETKYKETYRETISITQWKSMLQFTRNMAIVRGCLRPDFYELVVGARGTVDGDYGHAVYELAGSYPGAKKDPFEDLPTLRIKGVRGALTGDDERYHMRPRLEKPETDTVSMRFRRRPSLEMKEKWAEDWKRRIGGAICSWPPEDEQQERFMDFIRKRALQVMTEDKRQVLEFTTQMLDGLDVRETMRNWHTGKLFVQQTPQPRGKVGSVIVIWEDQPLEPVNDWRVTFYAEHQNESDIAFFATDPSENVVGPRITRTQFGGILSIYPAWGIPNVWRSIQGRDLQWCSEILLAGGIVYSPDRLIAYVAPKPPGPLMRALATEMKKHIIYMPPHMFSQRRLNKIRKFHILGGHDVRLWARDFIFEDD